MVHLLTVLHTSGGWLVVSHSPQAGTALYSPILLLFHVKHVWCAEREAQSGVIVQLESLLSTQGFLKRLLNFKSEHVRTAAYTLISHICYRCGPT